MEYSTKKGDKVVNPKYFRDEQNRVVEEVFLHGTREFVHGKDDEVIVEFIKSESEYGTISIAKCFDIENDENIEIIDNALSKINVDKIVCYDKFENVNSEIVFDNLQQTYTHTEYYPEVKKVFGRERTKDVRVYNNEEELISFTHYNQDGKEVINIIYSPQYNELLLKEYDFDKQEYKTRVFNNKDEELEVSKIKTSTMEQTRISIEESEQTIHKEENKELSDTVSVLQDASKSEELETKKQKCFVIN